MTRLRRMCLLSAECRPTEAFLVASPVSHRRLSALDYLLSRVSPFAFCVISGLLTFAWCLPGALLTTYVSPGAASSGIPGIIAYINGTNLSTHVSVPTAAVTAFGCVCSVASGLACGPEGPIIHLGACVGNIIGSAFPEIGKDGLTKRNLVMLGAGSGVAAAFMAPTAGVMLVIEEVSIALTTAWNIQSSMNPV